MPSEDGYCFIEDLRRLPADRGGKLPVIASRSKQASAVARKRGAAAQSAAKLLCLQTAGHFATP
jgi:hypothetical protein